MNTVPISQIIGADDDSDEEEEEKARPSIHTQARNKFILPGLLYDDDVSEDKANEEVTPDLEAHQKIVETMFNVGLTPQFNVGLQPQQLSSGERNERQEMTYSTSAASVVDNAGYKSKYVMKGIVELDRHGVPGVPGVPGEEVKL